MKKLFTLFFALPLLFVACDENPETPKPTPNEPTLELTSEATMEFDAEGGKGEITYNLIKGDGSLDGELGITGQASPKLSLLSRIGLQSLIASLSWVQSSSRLLKILLRSSE